MSIEKFAAILGAQPVGVKVSESYAITDEIAQFLGFESLGDFAQSLCSMKFLAPNVDYTFRPRLMMNSRVLAPMLTLRGASIEVLELYTEYSRKHCSENKDCFYHLDDNLMNHIFAFYGDLYVVTGLVCRRWNELLPERKSNRWLALTNSIGNDALIVYCLQNGLDVTKDLMRSHLANINAGTYSWVFEGVGQKHTRNILVEAIYGNDIKTLRYMKASISGTTGSASISGTAGSASISGTTGSAASRRMPIDIDPFEEIFDHEGLYNKTLKFLLEEHDQPSGIFNVQWTTLTPDGRISREPVGIFGNENVYGQIYASTRRELFDWYNTRRPMDEAAKAGFLSHIVKYNCHIRDRELVMLRDFTALPSDILYTAIEGENMDTFTYLLENRADMYPLSEELFDRVIRTIIDNAELNEFFIQELIRLHCPFNGDRLICDINCDTAIDILCLLISEGLPFGDYAAASSAVLRYKSSKTDHILNFICRSGHFIWPQNLTAYRNCSAGFFRSLRYIREINQEGLMKMAIVLGMTDELQTQR